MKYKVLLILLLTIASHAIHAQTEWTYDRIKTEFTTDTSSVETEMADLLDRDYSTIGMINASLEYEKRYDELLNKYYKILYASLDEEGKKVLKTSQLNWIKFRDSEKKLITKINSINYEEAGGGTIWGVIAASTRAELTKKRVIELYAYLMYGYIGG